MISLLIRYNFSATNRISPDLHNWDRYQGLGKGVHCPQWEYDSCNIKTLWIKGNSNSGITKVMLWPKFIKTWAFSSWVEGRKEGKIPEPRNYFRRPVWNNTAKDPQKTCHSAPPNENALHLYNILLLQTIVSDQNALIFTQGKLSQGGWFANMPRTYSWSHWELWVLRTSENQALSFSPKTTSCIIGRSRIRIWCFLAPSPRLPPRILHDLVSYFWVTHGNTVSVKLSRSHGIYWPSLQRSMVWGLPLHIHSHVIPKVLA